MKGQALKRINEAKNAAGERAEVAAAHGDYISRDDWVGIAVELDAIFRKAAELHARELTTRRAA